VVVVTGENLKMTQTISTGLKREKRESNSQLEDTKVMLERFFIVAGSKKELWRYERG